MNKIYKAIFVTVEIHKQIKILASKRGVSIIKLIEQFLKENKTK